jgi:hypothetical protein
MIRSTPVLAKASFARAAVVSVISIASLAGTARAHPIVEEGHRLYEEAEFVAALDALSRAEAADDLELDDLIVLFETRALVQSAMGHDDAMREDLQRLVAVAPDHTVGPEAHPDVRRALAEIRAEGHGELRVRASTEATEAGVTIRVEIENDWAHVVRELRTIGRVRGAPSWERAIDAPLLVPASGAALVEYYAEAVGPGGVVLARSGGFSRARARSSWRV